MNWALVIFPLVPIGLLLITLIERVLRIVTQRKRPHLSVLCMQKALDAPDAKSVKTPARPDEETKEAQPIVGHLLDRKEFTEYQRLNRWGNS